MKNSFTKIISTTSLSAAFLMALVATSADAASFKVLPGGTQLDSDPIDDIGTNVGEMLSFISQVDTTGLTTSLTFLELEFSFDTTELLLEQVNIIDDQVFDIAISPPVVDGMGISTQTVTFTAFSTGQPPNTVLDRDNLIFSVVGLQNDGLADIQALITSATDANGTDVTSLFQPPDRFEVQQAIPEPTATLGVLAFGSFGLASNFLRKKK